MKNAKKINGVTNIDTPSMEAMRQTVVEQELSARSWKAFYEKMYYSLEAEKIEPLYKEYQERAKVRIEQEKANMEQFMAKLNAEIKNQNESDPAGELRLEPEN